MITITQECLYDFMADLWNGAEQTCGNSRFLRGLGCWLTSCTYKNLPKYMKSEYDRGRIIIYPGFPELVCDNMEHKSIYNLLMRACDFAPKGSLLERDIKRALEKKPK